jgi:hypothetical protein
MSTRVETVGAMYEAFDDRLDDMLGACTDSPQKALIRGKYNTVQQQRDQAVNKDLDANSKELQDLCAKAKSVTCSITSFETSAGTYSKWLGYASDAAALAIKIVAYV